MNLRQLATATVALSLVSAQTAPLLAQSAQQGFNVAFPNSHNPFSIYTPVNVKAPSLANSVRLDQCIHDGKLYLSLDDAIDLALENNLDIEVSRYNLPIANMDVLRTAAGGYTLGVPGVVDNTLGGASASSAASSVSVSGAAGGQGGLVQSTSGLGYQVPSFDPHIQATASTEHLTQPQVNIVTTNTPFLKENTIIADATYYQSFPTGTYVEFDLNNQRQTINSQFSTLNPSLNANYRFLIQQQLLYGFGFSPNLRWLRLAKNNRKLTEIAFRQQIDLTVTQIENIYWDLVNAFQDEQVKERSLAFAEKSRDDEQKQLELKAVPAMDVMKAETEVATRQQDLTISKATLQLQQSLMKAALTKQLDQTLEEMPVIPTVDLDALQPEVIPPVQQLIDQALKSRPDLNILQITQDSAEISRKAVRNAMLPTVTLSGYYAGYGLGGVTNPLSPPTVPTPSTYGGTLQNAFNNSSPDYLAEVQVSIPLRNRQARADQFRSELEYRQAELNVVQQTKNLRIEVRNVAYALEQGQARVEAARKARDLAQRTFDIMKQEQQLGAGSNFQTVSAEHDLAIASSTLASAETAYEKSRVALYSQTGQTLNRLGISMQDARAGVVNKPVSPIPPSALQPPPSAPLNTPPPATPPASSPQPPPQAESRVTTSMSSARQRSTANGTHTQEKLRPRLLIADDQPPILDALELLLRPEGYRVDRAASPRQVIECLASETYEAVLMDMNYTRDTTSGAEGIDLLAEIQSYGLRVPVIVMTAWSSIELAVEAMRRGAADFIQKPWDNARLLSVLRAQLDLHRVQRQADMLEAENRFLRAEGLPTLIAESRAMQPVLEMIARIGPSDANVLITGEHGTGKEVVAQTLHAMSSRAQYSLVAVNTGALPEGTFESEIFGHVKGAFTDARTDRIGRFELADRGTLFLDEIANVPLRQQAKLLRVLETGELERVGSSKTRKVDVRLLSATNADLHKESDEGRFRPDLLFRLNTVEIHLPPLRERREDIPPLAGHFLSHWSKRYRRLLSGFSPRALEMMLQYAWPGNVRELDHCVERAVLMARTEKVDIGDLNLTPPRSSSAQSSLDDMSLEAVESILIRKALARAQGNVSQAAEALGLSRGALYRRMEKYAI